MAKPNSQSPNNSATSSETSETLSIDEHNTGTINKNLKTWKRIKEESEKGRPPWRSVSISKLPKADKEALLRAKLLDASRRLRLSKFSVPIQVDLPIYKSGRTVATPIQDDIITKRDASILTDGSIALKKQDTGEFILTHSVSQMTESITAIEAETQTLLPRSTSYFLEAYLSDAPYDENLFSTRERQLLSDIRELRKLDKKLRSNSNTFCHLPENTVSYYGDKTQLRQYFKDALNSSRSFLCSTNQSWDFSNSHVLPVWAPYTSKPAAWSNFIDTKIENRISKMTLQPVTKPRSAMIAYPPHYDVEFQEAVKRLVDESNKIFRVLTLAALKSNIKRSLQMIKPFKIKFPSSHWIPIIEKRAKVIKDLENELQFPQLRNVQSVTFEEYVKSLERN